MAKVIGIDLGTTMSAMAVIDEVGRPKIIHNAEGDNLTPSAILIKGDERIVGIKAKRSAKAHPERVAQLMKRRMNEPDWVFVDQDRQQHRPEELSALILRKLKQDAEKALGEEITSAVITVPAYFGDLERNRTKDAGKIAGFDVLGIINEPTAAAIAYGLEKGEPDSTMLVYDLGGGTFDVTVMKVIGTSEFQVLATEGNKYLGGFDFDDAVCKYCAQLFREKHGIDPLQNQQSGQVLYDEAERAKKELSSDTETEIYISAEGKSDVVDLTRDQFEALIRSFVGQTEHLTKKVLQHDKVRTTKIDKVLLVGGSTRIPLIQKLVKELCGVEPETGFNPDEVVALGAAIYAASLTPGTLPVGPDLRPVAALKVRDVTAHSLGVLAYNLQDELENHIIIPKQSQIPVEIKYPEFFSTRYDSQTSVNLPVVQGEAKDPALCRKVGEAAMLTGIPPQPKGIPQIEVTLGYDQSGIVRLFAKEIRSGREVRAEIQYNALLSDQELAQTTAKVEGLKVK
jgi:molecular chaperone DnaK